MIRLDCPSCGPRSQIEFTYGGDASPRPAQPETLSDADWHAYLFLRDNPCGRHRELWQHVAGCRRWLEVTRDTQTHEVLVCEPVHGRKP